MYETSKMAFWGMYSFIIAIAIMKAHMFYMVIRLLTKLDLLKPFNTYVSGQITHLSYYTLSIGIISYIGQQTAENLQHYGLSVDSLSQFWADSRAFILMSAVIYVIATIFSKGVELQNENDLTV
jgi:hypothetical protein